jgi:coenzyme F420-reducing hydrogenase delta subunit
VDYVSAGEAEKFLRVVSDMVDRLRALGSLHTESQYAGACAALP